MKVKFETVVLYFLFVILCSILVGFLPIVIGEMIANGNAEYQKQMSEYETGKNRKLCNNDSEVKSE